MKSEGHPDYHFITVVPSTRHVPHMARKVIVSYWISTRPLTLHGQATPTPCSIAVAVSHALKINSKALS